MPLTKSERKYAQAQLAFVEAANTQLDRITEIVRQHLQLLETTRTVLKQRRASLRLKIHPKGRDPFTVNSNAFFKEVEKLNSTWNNKVPLTSLVQESENILQLGRDIENALRLKLIQTRKQYSPILGHPGH